MVAELVALTLAAARIQPAQLGLDAVKQNVATNAQTFQSLSLGVVTDDGLVLTAGAPRDTVYRIGSVTKTFTGLLLLILRDEGKLSLDDPLTKWLPEAKGLIAPTTDSPPITLRNLVTHTSGIPRLGPIDYSDGHEVTEAEVLGGLKGLRLEFAPGSRISYSNLAMGLAGLVIKRVTKQPYRQVLKAKVLAPLGITGAWAKADVPSGKLAPSPGTVEWKLGPEESAGGLYLSLDELSKYVQLQLSAWPPRDGPESKVALRSTLRESQQRAGFSGAGRDGFGINWSVTEEETLGALVAHNGSTLDYHSSVFMLPHRGLAVIALASGGDSDHLSSFARAQLELLVKGLPRPTLAVGASARVALDRAKALIARCDEASMKAALTPAFFNSVWPRTQCRVFEGARLKSGLPVAEEQVLESDELGHARVRLRTDKDQRIEVSVWADSQPPNLMGGMVVKSLAAIGPPARAALDRVKALWAHCDEAAIKAAMEPKFIAQFPWKSTCDMFDLMRSGDGLPKSEDLLEADGSTQARVRIHTDHNHALDLSVTTLPDAPYLMTGLQVKPVP